MVNNNNIADHLQQISRLFSKNNDTWRGQAFSKAAGIFRVRKNSVTIIDNKIQDKIHGVGSAINDVIVQFVKTGTSVKYEKLRKLLPEDVVERFDAKVCKRKVSQLLKPLTNANVDWDFAGSMRRGMKTVKDVDVIICLNNKNERELVEKCLLDAGLEPDVRNGQEKVGVSVPIKNQGRKFTLDLNFTTPEHRGGHYLYFTGPRDFNISQRMRAKAKGYRLNQKGLFKNNKLVAGSTEIEIFKILGENYLEPNERA